MLSVRVRALCSEIYIQGLLVQILAWVIMQNEKPQHLASDEIQSKCYGHGEPGAATRLGPLESSGLRTRSSCFRRQATMTFDLSPHTLALRLGHCEREDGRIVST